MLRVSEAGLSPRRVPPRRRRDAEVGRQDPLQELQGLPHLQGDMEGGMGGEPQVPTKVDCPDQGPGRPVREQAIDGVLSPAAAGPTRGP